MQQINLSTSRNSKRNYIIYLFIYPNYFIPNYFWLGLFRWPVGPQPELFSDRGVRASHQHHPDFRKTDLLFLEIDIGILK